MANIYEGMNVRQKLAKARLQFLNQKVKKSGKNMHLEFKYFELEDIVPPAIRIFARVGLTTDIDFTDENGAVMRVYNTDNSEEAPIEFRVPYREVKPIVSNAGKEVTNPMQALGSSITYLSSMKWNDDKTITITPPAKPKKITGTRFAAIMGLNKWTSPFNAWCAITRTYEEPFEDTIYTIAGKTIEPKQAEYMKTAYFMSNLITPTDVYGEDYFKKTWGDFFRDIPIFGGMWDYLLVDKEGKPQTVLEMKTTKRSEDWVEDVPEYYALQAALYAYLLGVDDVIMVCSVLGEKDYDDPAAYECKAENTFVRPFKVSERYPNMKKTITQVKKWWKTHVEGGVSPKYDEKADADILKVLRDNNLSPDSDLDAMVKEAEGLMLHIEEVNATVADDEKRLKKLKELIKEASMSQFKPGDKTVTITGGSYDFVTTVSMKKKQDFDTEAMEKDGVLDKYMTETEKPEYRFTPKKRKD